MNSSQHQLIITFGLPGAGKTYVGQILARERNYFFFDGDNVLTDAMKKAIATQTPFTDEIRDEFFTLLIAQINELVQEHKNLVVAQTFIKEKYREKVLQAFPQVQFILVQATDAIREKRLVERTDYPLDIEYSKTMVKNFEKPRIDHVIIENNEEGEAIIRKQIQKILS